MQKNSQMNNSTFKSKPRYDILDGLRGVGAALVLIYHLCESHFGLGEAHPLNHGYLAVDFFFVLSGFVIGYAYDDRWDRMSTWTFFKRRLIRLQPMVIFGSVFGALFFYFEECSDYFGIANAAWWVVLIAMFWAFTMLPVPSFLDVRGWGETNPLNAPTWSLQWEYIANILYALVFRRFSRFWLTVSVILFGCMTVVLCLNIDITGWLSTRQTVMQYTVIGGWSITPEHIQVGLTRLLYPFFLGLLLSRFNITIKVRGGFWLCSAMLLGIFAVPRLGGETPILNGIFDATAILILLPLVVVIGAGSVVTDSKSRAVNEFLGNISYPLYITHYPLVHLQKQWIVNHPDAPVSTHIFIGVSVFIMSLMIAYASYKLYDIPVREWLGHKLLRKSVNNK